MGEKRYYVKRINKKSSEKESAIEEAYPKGGFKTASGS